VFLSDGRFQAYMQVHIQNDGPVTIPLESPSSVRDSKDAVCWTYILYVPCYYVILATFTSCLVGICLQRVFYLSRYRTVY